MKAADISLEDPEIVMLPTYVNARELFGEFPKYKEVKKKFLDHYWRRKSKMSSESNREDYMKISAFGCKGKFGRNLKLSCDQNRTNHNFKDYNFKYHDNLVVISLKLVILAINLIGIHRSRTSLRNTNVSIVVKLGMLSKLVGK